MLHSCIDTRIIFLPFSITVTEERKFTSASNHFEHSLVTEHVFCVTSDTYCYCSVAVRVVTKELNTGNTGQLFTVRIV